MNTLLRAHEESKAELKRVLQAGINRMENGAPTLCNLGTDDQLKMLVRVANICGLPEAADWVRREMALQGQGYM